MQSKKITRFAALMGSLLSLVLLLVLVQALAAQESPGAVRTPDLQVAKSVDVAEALPGDSVHYTIVMDNPGTSPATGVVLTDTVPNDLHSVSNLSVVGGGNFGLIGNVITWTGAVNNGAQVTIDFDATLTDTAVVGANIINTANVTGTGSLITDDASFTVIAEPPAVLHVDKTVQQAMTYPGGLVNYTVVISNSGTGTAPIVNLTDDLPAELTYEPGSLVVVGGGSYGVDNDVITWTGSITGSGGLVSISFDGRVADSVTDEDIIANTAIVSGVGDPVSDTVETGVQTTFIYFFPVIPKNVPTPVLNPVGIPTSNNNFQTFLLTPSWNNLGIPGVTYILQEARQPDFAGATEYNAGGAVSYAREHTSSFSTVPYYYRVRAVVNGVSSGWSNIQSERGVYLDNFEDPSSGWAIRRQDTDDTNNSSFYRNGTHVIKIGGRWDYAITSPLVSVPWSSYTIATRVRFDPGVDNLHGYGIIFGGDWNGSQCPNANYTSCFNQYYRLTVVWYGGTDSLRVQVKRITYHDADSNVGRGDSLWGYTDISVPSPGGWHEWKINVSQNGSISIYLDGYFLHSFVDTAFVGPNKYFGAFASSDEYSGTEPWYEWYRVTPLP